MTYNVFGGTLNLAQPNSMRHLRRYDFEGHPRSVRVTWDLKFQKWRFSKSISSAIFSTNQKNSNVFWYYTKITKIAQARILNFLLVIESRDFKVCQEIDFIRSQWNLYDVRGRWDIHNDMTFKVIWGQGQGQEMTSVPFRDYFYLYFNPLSPLH